MNKTFLKNSLITAMLISAPSFAGSGFAVFGGIGTTEHNFFEYDDSDTSFSLGGEFKFNSHFAAELRYDDYGKAAFDIEGRRGPLNVPAKSYGLGLKAMLPLGEALNAYAKVGYARWALFNGNGGETGSDFYYGLGGQFMATEKVGISLEYTMLAAGLDGFNDTSVDYDLNNLAVSVGYYF